MPDKTTLTVLIPTFNGHAHLTNTVRSVIDAARQEPNSTIVIVVTDNGSSDFSATQIAEICNRQQVELVRFVENLGFDANIRRAIQVVETSHVWILGDDDILAPGALREALHALRETGAPFLLAPPLFFRDGESYPETRLDPQRYVRFQNAEELLTQTKWDSSALSSHIWALDSWNKLNLLQYQGADWIHFAALVAHSKSSNSTTVSLPAGLVYVRIGVSRWETNFGSAYISGLKQLDIIQSAGSPDLFNVFRKARFRTNVHDAFFLTGSLSFAEKTRAKALILKNFGRNHRVLTLDIPALYAPSSLKRVVLSAGKLVSRLISRGQ